MIKIIISTILLMCFFVISYGQTEQKNIFEYGIVSYGDGGLKGPYASRQIKIYDDKTILFCKEGDYYQAKLENKTFEKLIKFLTEEPFLWETKYLEVKDGNIPGLHGGFFYLYYLSGNDRKIIVSHYEPTEGEWMKIVKMISKLHLKSKKKLGAAFHVKLGEKFSDTDIDAIFFAYDFYEQHKSY